MSQQFPAGSLGEALENEHHAIDGGIEAYMASLADGTPDSRPLLEAMQALRRHIYLEEELLFPELKGDPSLPMAMFVMLREHGQIWRAMDELSALLANGGDAATLRKVCEDLLALLASHNYKEEPVIYGKADAVLSAQIRDQIQDFLPGGVMPEDWVCKNLTRPPAAG